MCAAGAGFFPGSTRNRNGSPGGGGPPGAMGGGFVGVVGLASPVRPLLRSGQDVPLLTLHVVSARFGGFVGLAQGGVVPAAFGMLSNGERGRVVEVRNDVSRTD